MSVDQLRELLPFLHDKNPQVRQIALANLLGHTPKEAPHRSIFYAGLQGGGLQQLRDSEVIRDLKLLCRDTLAAAHDAFRALINLSDNALLVQSLSEPHFLSFIVSYVLNYQSTLADLGSMLLSNLTTSAATCATLLSLKIPVLPDSKSPALYFPVQSRSGTCPAPVPYPSGEPREILALPLLIDAFVQAAAVDETEDKSKRLRRGDLHFLSSVFANISATPAGRTFFLTPRIPDPLSSEGDLEYPLSKILMFTEHKDTIRRGGVASTLKNCAFNAHAHRALLSPETLKIAVPPSDIQAPGIDILPYLLLPLAGPEELDLEEKLLPPALQFLPPTKTREPDQVLRLTHIETLLLLCTTFWGREYLRSHGVYEIVRALHEHETVEKISEQVERLVNFLKGEESTDTKVDAYTAPEGVADGSEDEDSRIEEV